MVLINVDYVSTPEISLWICNAFRISTYESFCTSLPSRFNDRNLFICQRPIQKTSGKKRILRPNDSKNSLNCRQGKRMNK